MSHEFGYKCFANCRFVLRLFSLCIFYVCDSVDNIADAQCSSDGCAASGDVDGERFVATSQMHPLCCADNSSVTVTRIGAGKWPIIVIDDFFCPQYLSSVRAELMTSSNWDDTHEVFPGKFLDFGKGKGKGKKMSRQGKGRRDKGALERLQEQEHVKCFISALGVHGADRKIRDISDTRVSYVAKKPIINNIHVDVDQMILNVHVSTDFNDTGTSFWRVPAGKKFPAARSTKHVYELWEENTVILIQAAMEYHRKALREIGHEHAYETDLTGTYEKYHHELVRTNRAILYSGNLLHSAYLPPAAAARTEDSTQTDKRSVIQSFMELEPFLALVGATPYSAADEVLGSQEMSPRQALSAFYRPS